ncbi:hypothetical protein O3M35_004331 [Rhynocoris fuscipes]|uniref:Glucosidase 2 subunit beta n=1 Tax=Rhynocoris fuscipes TaxID=488301 RepID=A0AAW1CH23_9HEMI
MFNIQVILILVSLFIYSKGYDKLIPRGVSLSQRLFYEPLKDFSCLDGSKRFPFIYVNDDYCDCADGSDEPGTSACPNGQFHCQNIGYIPLNLPTSRVNDGVCDCCDATDEYLYDNCTNVCQILGAEARKAAEKEAEVAAQGNQLRLQMITTGKEIRQNKQDRLTALEADKLEAVRLKEEANRLKESAEAAEFAAKEAFKTRQQELKLLAENLEKERLENEARTLFKQLDANNDDIVQFEEFNIKVYVDGEENDAQTFDRQHVQQYFGTNTADGNIDWQSFLNSYPKLSRDIIRDENKSHDSTAADKAPPQDQQNNNEQEWAGDINLNVNNEEGEQNAHEYFEDDETIEDEFVSGKIEESVSDDGKTIETGGGEEEEEEDDDDEDEEEFEMEKERLDRTMINDSNNNNNNNNNYDEETLKVIEEANAARSRFESAERSVQDVERELTRIKESLSKDYGPEDEFIVLDGQCFSYTDREYTYKLCPFDQVVQMAKSGGSETRLGVWAGWQDERLHKVMIYDKGQACWNGPQRSTKVVVVCGLDNAVIAAVEPNKCEYELILQTPAACKLPIQPQTTHTHDEF